MIRFVIPFLVVTIISWVMLYALKPSLQKKVWGHTLHALIAISLAIVSIIAVFVTFFFIGAIHHG